MSILRSQRTPARLGKKETFNVPVDLIIYGSLVVASLTLLVGIIGGLFV